MTCNKIVNCAYFEQDELDAVRRSEALLAQRYGFLIRDHNIDFIGLCPECRGARNRQPEAPRAAQRRAARATQHQESPVKEGTVMRIAIATDEDYVSAGFGCAPFCTISSIATSPDASARPF